MGGHGPSWAKWSIVAAGTVAIAVAAVVTVTRAPLWTPALVGFSSANARAQVALERRLATATSPTRLAATHRTLTERVHVAGTPRDRFLAGWMRDQWEAAGLSDLELVEHEVLLPYPVTAHVEILDEAGGALDLLEPEIEGRPFSDDPVAHPFHAYSASGEVTGELVYAGEGRSSDFDWLAAQGIDVRGRVVLIRHSDPYSYRGSKVFAAEAHGAAAVLTFTDPADDGFPRGAAYPEDRWATERTVQRGAVAYDFLVPGDPLTPGWASTADAPRLAPGAAPALPRIISLPIPVAAATRLLAAGAGPEAPPSWRGALAVPYRVGPGARVRVGVENDAEVRPIWTVTGRLVGSEQPDEWVIVGNHRDAWTFGGADPSSGTAVLMELVRVLGQEAAAGWRPKRTIVFASWDAEEYASISSTEWGEQFADALTASAVAYLNVDSAVTGDAFRGVASPTLARLLASAAGVREASIGRRPGGGSDYGVFLNHLGIPVVDMGFSGRWGLYHSMYDNHDWVARLADPGFVRHEQLTRIWGALATRLANADVLPLDYAEYARRIDEFVEEVGRRRPRGGAAVTPEDLALLALAQARFAAAARGVTTRALEALTQGDRSAVARVNDALRLGERALLDADGLPGRSWYRHLVFAPRFSYEPEILPGVSAAIEAGSTEAVTHEVRRLAAALDRAAAALVF